MHCQPSLFGGTSPTVDVSLRGLKRIVLDETSWLDHQPSWLQGHEEVFTRLCESTDWRVGRREMYDRIVDVPRLIASFPEDGPGHPLMDVIRRSLDARYGVPFTSVSAALYRDGEDSVALHGDTWARSLPQSLVAIVSVGAPRRFLLRPHVAQKAASRTFALGWGDLLVMGGACQRDWLHGIPKVSRAEPRMSIMFRPLSEAFDEAVRRERFGREGPERGGATSGRRAARFGRSNLETRRYDDVSMASPDDVPKNPSP